METNWGTTAAKTYLAPDAEHLAALTLAAEMAGTRFKIEGRNSPLEMQNAALRYRGRVPEIEQNGAIDRALRAMKAGGGVVWILKINAPGMEEASLDDVDARYAEFSVMIEPPRCP